jgi:hypothetical protein
MGCIKLNKITIAVTAALFVVAAVPSHKAYAISEGYRKQLERSGCTQVSESQGCRLDKSKDWNTKHGFIKPVTTTADSWEAKKAKNTAFIEEEVLGAMGMDARQKLLLNGWKRPNQNADRWVKDGFVLTLETDKKGRVISGDLK